MGKYDQNCFVGFIDNLDWNSKKNSITIEGYCYIEGINQIKDNCVKKSVIISLCNKKYLIPLKNTLREDLVSYEGFDYRYAGFIGSIDLGYIDTMDSLSPGKWEISVNLIVDDIEVSGRLHAKDIDMVCTPKIMKNKLINKFVRIEPCIEDNLFLIKSEIDDFVEIKENIFLKKFKNMLKALKEKINKIKLKLIACLYRQFKKMKLKENRILFLSDSRENMNGNFEFVYKELINRGGFEIKTFLKPSISEEFDFKEKISFLYYVATSKFILLDDFYPKIYNFNIREGVEVIQLWHACGAFKTFGFSRLGKVGGPKMRSKNHRNYTKAIVSSEDIRKHYAEGFGISEDKVIATGVPRTDIFFNEDYKNEKIKELTKKYPIIKNKKVIMFAPTFRGNGQKTAYYDFEKFDIKRLYRELSDEYVIIMKLHPFVKSVPQIEEKYSNFLIDLTSEREINDLLFISDILITDYSSVCFEYSLLNRPMIFFAYDMDEYIEKRDFYYPYKSFVPGPIAKTTDEIITIIKEGKYDLEKLHSFRKRFFTHLDGKSTQRVVDLITDIKNNN